MDWISSEPGRQARALAAQLLTRLPGEPLKVGSELRRALPDLSPEQASLAILQAQLAATASRRYGIDAQELLLTRDGLEQATRPEVAARRAALLRRAGATTVVDLTAGLGFDVQAFLASGLSVIAVERDPRTAECLRANAPGAQVIEADATAVIDSLLPRLAPDAVLFLDPARRGGRRTSDGSRAQSERDPQRWSPPWSFVLELAARGARVCVKLAPGFDPALVPAGWSGVWTSVRREPVEAMLCSWALPAPRTACAIGDTTAEFGADGRAGTRLAPIGQWLHEPDASLVQAQLLDDLCAAVPELARTDGTGSWLTSQEELTHPMLRGHEVIARLPNDSRALRKALISRGIGELTIKCRGMKIDADAMRRELRLPAGAPGVLAILRESGARSTVLVHEHR